MKLRYVIFAAALMTAIMAVVLPSCGKKVGNRERRWQKKK